MSTARKFAELIGRQLGLNPSAAIRVVSALQAARLIRKGSQGGGQDRTPQLTPYELVVLAIGLIAPGPISRIAGTTALICSAPNNLENDELGATLLDYIVSLVTSYDSDRIATYDCAFVITLGESINATFDIIYREPDNTVLTTRLVAARFGDSANNNNSRNITLTSTILGMIADIVQFDDRSII